MDQRDSHCPYLFCCEITAKPTVLVFVLMCCHSCVTLVVLPIFTFRLTLAFRAWDLNWLYAQQRGKKTLLSLTLICYCQLISTAKIVRGSWIRSTTMKHRYLTIWLTYCISIAYTYVLVETHLSANLSERVQVLICHWVSRCITLTDYCISQCNDWSEFTIHAH